ncbi:MAG: hypothetical protein LBQ66_01325 [Planctomycetaceae bacterium]|nr:hypothetical protein [Planctomycetaceae bacterium]
MPNRFGVQFKLVWFYYTQRRAGRPRSSPSPLRGKFLLIAISATNNLGVFFCVFCFVIYLLCIGRGSY